MKKKSIAAALALCLLCCSAFSMTAFAAENQTSATTSLLYSVQGGYTVNIPASVDLNSQDSIEITASDMNIPDGQILVVKVSDDSLDSVNEIKLTDDSSGQSIGCRVFVGSLQNSTMSSSYMKVSDASKDAAIFTQGSIIRDGKYVPVVGGLLKFEITNNRPVVGNFAGNINFVIGFEDARI